MGAWPKSRRRWVLAGLLGCLALLVAAPVALAGTGTVSGKVTSGAFPHPGIEKVEVRFYKTEGSWNREFTGAGGDYSVGLEPGEYTVEFVPESSSGYASQYYPEKLSYATAAKITVEEGKNLTISAELSEGNTITGAVTSYASGSELAGIEVTAYEAQAPNNAIQSVETNKFGKYKLSGISKGEYVLGFKPGLESGLNYAPQFYNESAKFGEATTINLTEGENREDIDAKLREGGSISGTVTDAATHQPLAGIVAVAVSAGDGDPVSVAVSGASGAYELPGMASGSVVVAFILNTKEDQMMYLPQLYDGRPFPESFKEFSELLVFGTPVKVTAGADTTEIDAAMVRKEPANALAPVASGTPAVGQTLSCANGTWTGIAPLTYAEQWLRNGAAIAGATASTYVVQAADEGHGLACEVTATNEFGKASATSNTLTVSLPSAPSATTTTTPVAPAAAVPVLVVSNSKIVVSGGVARVPIACKNANCSGTVELTEQVVVKHRHGKKTTSKKETVVLAEGSYSLAAGHSATIDIHLAAKGKSVLATAKHHELSVKISASVTGGKTVNESVTLSEAAPAKHKSKHK
jgi:hypothetical protein